MNVERRVRPVAVGCAVVTGLAVIYSAVLAVTRLEPDIGPVVQSIMHLAVLVLLVAIATSGSGGRGWAARLGFGAGVLGFLLLAAAELTYPVSPALGDQLFAVAPLLGGVGLVVAGIAVVTHRAWRGWHRPVLLVAGLWTFVVLTPALVLSGGPPAAVAVWAITGWELCFFLVAVSLHAEVTAERRTPALA